MIMLFDDTTAGHSMLQTYRLWDVDSGVLGAVGVFITPEECKGCKLIESLGSHTSLSKNLKCKD